MFIFAIFHPFLSSTQKNKFPKKYRFFNDSLFIKFVFSLLLLFFVSVLVQLQFNSRTLLIYSCSSHATIHVLLNLTPISTFLRHKENILRKSRCIPLRLASSFVWLRKNIRFEQNIRFRVYYTKSISIGSINKTGQCAKVPHIGLYRKMDILVSNPGSFQVQILSKILHAFINKFFVFDKKVYCFIRTIQI